MTHFHFEATYLIKITLRTNSTSQLCVLCGVAITVASLGLSQGRADMIGSVRV